MAPLISAWNEEEWTLVEPLGPMWTNPLLKMRAKVSGVPHGHWCWKCVRRRRGDGCECGLWAQILMVLFTKDVVLLNHLVPQFLQLQDENNHSIYCIRLLWESNRWMHLNCELPVWDAVSAQQGSAALVVSRGHPVKSGDPQWLGGRRRRENCHSLQTLCIFVLSIFCTVCIHYLDFIFKSNRAPC